MSAGLPTPQKYQYHNSRRLATLGSKAALPFRAPFETPIPWAPQDERRISNPTPQKSRHHNPRHLAEGKQAGAQILTYRKPFRVSRSGAGVWGAEAHHEGAGPGGRPRFPLAQVQGCGSPVNQAAPQVQEGNAAPQVQKRPRASGGRLVP